MNVRPLLASMAALAILVTPSLAYADDGNPSPAPSASAIAKDKKSDDKKSDSDSSSSSTKKDSGQTKAPEPSKAPSSQAPAPKPEPSKTVDPKPAPKPTASATPKDKPSSTPSASPEAPKPSNSAMSSANPTDEPTATASASATPEPTSTVTSSPTATTSPTDQPVKAATASSLPPNSIGICPKDDDGDYIGTQEISVTFTAGSKAVSVRLSSTEGDNVTAQLSPGESRTLSVTIGSDATVTAYIDGKPVESKAYTPSTTCTDDGPTNPPTADADGDGVPDSADKCPNTPPNSKVDSDGCAASQRDDDADGVTNDKDKCASTPKGEKVDANGCSDSQKDSDGDGVVDSKDQCPSTPTGTKVDANGCPVKSEYPYEVSVWWKMDNPDLSNPNSFEFPQTRISGEPAPACQPVKVQFDEYTIDDEAAKSYLAGLKVLNSGADDARLHPHNYYAKIIVDKSLCEQPPTKIQIPATPDEVDPCGPNNAHWNVPIDTGTLDWTLRDDGHLIVTIVAKNTQFDDGTTSHDYGAAVDSGEQCPPVTPVVKAELVADCYGVYFDVDGSELKEAVTVTLIIGMDRHNYTVEPGAFVADFYDGAPAGTIVKLVDESGKDLADPVTVPDNCTPPQYQEVTATASCGAVTFYNPASNPGAVALYGSFYNPAPDGQVIVQPGESATVKTKRSSVDYLAYSDDKFGVLIGYGENLKVPQGCGGHHKPPVKHHHNPPAKKHHKTKWVTPTSGHTGV